MQNRDTWSPRPATVDDLRRLLELEAQIQLAPWTKSHFEGEFEKPYSHVWVFTDDETDERIGAYLVFWILGTEARLQNLGVDPTLQRQGLARMLLNKAVTAAKKQNATRFGLEVRKSNLGAIQLYQNAGFEILHLRKNFYSNGEDAYLMELDLRDNALGQDD